MSNNNSASGGISFCGALTILFIGLKICKVITWPWIWVLSPIWISLAIALLIIILFVIANLLTISGNPFKKSKNK